MPRVPVKLVLVRHLHDLAQVHHGHTVADVPHHRKIVSDEQVGDPVLRLKVFQQVDHLGLDRDVQRRHRLVADDEAGPCSKGPGNSDPLPLAPAELVRVAIPHRAVQTHRLEQIAHPPPVILPVAVQPVRPDRLAHDVARRHPRVQSAVGVLEHHADLASHPPKLGAPQRRHILPLERHPPGRRPR